MRISTHSTPEAPLPAASQPSEAATPEQPPQPARRSAPSAEPLRSAALQPARHALAALPDIDQAKIDAVRDALARGDIQFDAQKLAGLIARYHGAAR